MPIFLPVRLVYSAGMTDAYPMRINKYLAQQGLATRRGADALVAGRKVLINGRVAVLGDQVQEGDRIELQGARLETYAYYAYHKPRGIITHSAQKGEKDILHTLPKALQQKIFPVGRLDKDSSGLIILTNDGRVTDRLLNPEREHDKEYRVRVVEELPEHFKKKMERGVFIEGYKTKPCSVRVTGARSFLITLTEGKKHQIRRMVTALKNQVDELTRTRILNIRLGDLAPGDTRSLGGSELREFLSRIGLKN